MLKLHPAIVHFPVALISIAALFAVLSLFRKKEFFKEVAFWNLLIGTLGALAAVLTGLMELKNLVHDDAIHSILEKHELTGFAILILSLTLSVWFWLRRNKFSKNEYKGWVVSLLLGLAMVTYQGYLGGRMVFEKGAGVKPMEAQLEKTAKSHSHSKPAHAHDTTSLSNTTPSADQHAHPVTAQDHHDSSSLKTDLHGKKQDIPAASEHIHKNETMPGKKENIQSDAGHVHKKETVPERKQDLPASEHDHKTNKDSAASKPVVDPNQNKIQPGPVHDHKNVKDTSALKKTTPGTMQDSVVVKEKKKTLKNMKY